MHMIINISGSERFKIWYHDQKSVKNVVSKLGYSKVYKTQARLILCLFRVYAIRDDGTFVQGQLITVIIIISLERLQTFFDPLSPY